MEGDLAGEGGPAASTVMSAADSARMWNAGKGGAYWAPGVLLLLLTASLLTVLLAAHSAFGAAMTEEADFTADPVRCLRKESLCVC